MNGRGVGGEGEERRVTRGTPRRNRRGTAEAGRREKREGGMKSREDEGIEDRWKRRAELSAESPGRKTRHHRKIALSRTHLFSIPSSWPFAPALGTTLRPPPPTPPPRRTARLAFLSSACTSRDSSIQQRIYKSVSSVSFVPLGSPDPILRCHGTHARSLDFL